MRAIVLVLAVGLLLPASAWPVSDADVQACIATNGPRYETPADAVAAQYIDIAAACRAMVARGDGGIVATPQGGGASGSGIGSPDRNDQAARATTPAERAKASALVQRLLAGEQGEAGSPLDGLTALPWPFWAFFTLIAGCIVAAGAAQWRRR